MATSKQTTKPKAQAPVAATAKTKADTSKAAKSTKSKEEPKRDSVLVTKFQALKKRLQDTWAEIQKITWPDGDTVRNLTALVIAMATFLGIILGGIDYVLLKIFESV